jgi:8-oxo-dGTP pyrophosphatase MutT (NUDIX family)
MTSPSVSLHEPADVFIREIERADFTVSPAPWPFALERRAEIDEHFAGLQKAKPSLWNGRVMLFRRCAFSGRTLTGEAFETDYASFTAWHAWQRPDATVKNCFATAAVIGSDGGFLLGQMGPHTANAGHIYFPCGTPDPEDVTGDRVDFDLSARRELLEETGMADNELDVEPGWTVVEVGPFIALFKRMRAAEPAETVREKMRGFLSRQKQPELSDIIIVRKPGDISPLMPPFVMAFLEHALSSRVLR